MINKVKQAYRRYWAVRHFLEIFGFHPKEIENRGRRREICIVLAKIAINIQRKNKVSDAMWTHLALKHGKGEHPEWQEYSTAIYIIEQFDPGFAAQIPHWSEFSKDIIARHDSWITAGTIPFLEEPPGRKVVRMKNRKAA